jgi:hypothetical protein
MTKPRLKGFLLLLLGATTFVALGFSWERNSSVAMVDFKAVYYGTRCLLQHGDPYKESDLLLLFLAEDREPLATKLLQRDAVAVNVNLPTASPFIVPFAILPWVGGGTPGLDASNRRDLHSRCLPHVGTGGGICTGHLGWSPVSPPGEQRTPH